jgi:hypothetical protein
MSEDMLLPASSNREKSAIPFSLNEKSTELLDSTAIDEPINQLESDKKSFLLNFWRKAWKFIL